MIRQTLKEWQAEAIRRFGNWPGGWAFQCPHCGYVTCVAEWKARSFDPQHAPTMCIGRFLPDSRGELGNTYAPCNWAAFGLFGTLGEGRTVIFNEDDDDHSQVFDFPGHGSAADVLNFMDRAEAVAPHAEG